MSAAQSWFLSPTLISRDFMKIDYHVALINIKKKSFKLLLKCVRGQYLQ